MAYICNGFPMRRIFRKSIKIGRMISVILALAAMFVVGLDASDRMESLHPRTVSEVSIEPEATAEFPPDETRLVEKEGPVEDKTNASENMTPSGKPNCEPQAYFVSAAVFKTGDSNSRLRVEHHLKCEYVIPELDPTSLSSLATSSSSVGSDICRRFTLVGARPSGTS